MGLYCGIDLHSNNHVMTVIDEGDRRLYERRLPNDLAITKAALEPFRAQLVAVAVESTSATRVNGRARRECITVDAHPAFAWWLIGSLAG